MANATHEPNTSPVPQGGDSRTGLINNPCRAAVLAGVVVALQTAQTVTL